MACNSVPWDIWKMLFRGFALGGHVIRSPGRSTDSLSRFSLWHVIRSLGYLADALSRFFPMACNSVPWDIWQMLFRGFVLWHVIRFPGRSVRLGCVPVISPGMLLRGFSMTTCNSEPWEIL